MTGHPTNSDGDARADASKHPPLPPPPRTVPLVLRWVLLLGTHRHDTGSAFLGMGLGILLAMFSPGQVVQALIVQLDGTPVEGTVRSIEETQTEYNEETVLAVTADYATPSGDHTVRSFTTATSRQVGDRVMVQRGRNLPSVAVISGMSSTRVPLWMGLFIGIFPLAGAGLMLRQARRGLQLIRLLSRGAEAQAVRTSVEESNVRINGQPVMKVRYQFEDAHGDMWPAEARSVDTRRLEDDATERVIYLPNQPLVSMVVDELPSWLRSTHTGWEPPPVSGVVQSSYRLAFIAVCVTVGAAVGISTS